MTDIISAEEHRKRVRFRQRILLISAGCALVGVICLGIIIQGHVQSAILGGIAVVGLVLAVITYVWSLVLRFIILAKQPPSRPLR
jgi:uncharacterized membrane protein YfcA